MTTDLSPEDSAKVQLMADLARPDTYAKVRLGMSLHPKQAAVLRDLFKPKSRVSARCANEVGKTSHIAVAAILYAIEMLDAQCISTAGSWMQVSQQLIPKLKAQSFRFPRWEFLDTAIKIDSVERYLGFSTRDEGTAQGFHADPNRPLLAIIDEAAAVPLPIFNAIEERCNPTHLLIMGSPLDPAGQFYSIETNLAKHYTHHHINQIDCSTANGYWVDQAGIDRKIAKYGAEHPLVLSNVFGEFAKSVEGALLSLREWINCQNNPPPVRDGDLHAFIDVAGGGNKNIFVFRRGNKLYLDKIWRDKSEMAAIGEIISLMHKRKKSDGLLTENVSIDASGAGKPMADRLHELGYPVNKYHGQSPARFDDDYYNQRAETWGRGCAAIKACQFILPDNEELRMQCLQATIKRHSSGKFLMKSKEDMIKDGLESPDEADACWSKDTMIHTSRGVMPIICVQEGDLVLTPFGYSPVIKFHINEDKETIQVGSLIGTPNHKVFVVGYGWKRMDAVLLTDRLESVRMQPVWNILRSLFTRAENIAFKPLADIIKTRTGTALRRDFFIESSGRSIMGLLSRACLCITKMAIGRITGLPIWNSWKQVSIRSITCGISGMIQNGLLALGVARKRQSLRQRSGIKVFPATIGTQNMAGEPCGNDWPIFQQYAASIAEKSFRKQPCQFTSSALSNAVINRPLSGTRLVVSVLFAVVRFSLINIVRHGIAVRNVSGSQGRQTVYNLTVESENAYYANGVLVQNCLGAMMPAPMLKSVNLVETTREYNAGQQDGESDSERHDGNRRFFS